ncbi:MAG: Hpt domain-containing protein [Planctomycetota bacterium]|nr:Hpt domain-containing protein [Planctomycetota bacterium]
MKTLDFSGIRNNTVLPSPHDVEIPSDIDDLLEDYVESTESILGELEQAALALEARQSCGENSAAARRTLHKIKGESSMVGFEQICEFCHQTEFAFEELPENKRPDMLLRFKDWVLAALYSMVE